MSDFWPLSQGQICPNFWLPKSQFKRISYGPPTHPIRTGGAGRQRRHQLDEQWRGRVFSWGAGGCRRAAARTSFVGRYMSVHGMLILIIPHRTRRCSGPPSRWVEDIYRAIDGLPSTVSRWGSRPELTPYRYSTTVSGPMPSIPGHHSSAGT